MLYAACVMFVFSFFLCYRLPHFLLYELIQHWSFLHRIFQSLYLLNQLTNVNNPNGMGVRYNLVIVIDFFVLNKQNLDIR